MTVRFALLGVLSIMLLATSTVAVAQYPGPAANITLTPSDATPEPGSTVTIAISVTDGDGEPVEGVGLTAEITSQPGDSAEIIDPANVTTGADGTASIDVFVGHDPGQVVVLVTANDLEASVVLSVGVDPIPPDTGTSGAASASDSSLIPGTMATVGIVAAGIGLLAGAIAGGFVVRGRTRV